jgi:chemotaxis protein CheX
MGVAKATSASRAIPVETLDSIVRSVWTSITPLELDGPLSGASEPTGDGVVVAWVRIGGEWDGVVVLHAAVVLARTIACHMFECSDATDEDVRDAWGELANQVGGWVKASVGGHCVLSLPETAHGEGPAACGLSSASHFDAEGEPLSVLVFDVGARMLREAGSDAA